MIEKDLVLSEIPLIAPCGINCELCRAYIRERNACPACRGDDRQKSNACVSCKIKNCPNISSGAVNFCSDCNEFPCELLKRLEKRYTLQYEVSVIGNLRYIKKYGVENFIKKENRAWACPECGELLCMHKDLCPSCGYCWR